MKNTYEDIIHLPHHVSPTRPQMSMSERAAQFSPFAALTGYGDVIAETARTTDQQAELDEDLLAELDQKLRVLAEHLQDVPKVSLTYFQPDIRKEGGAYRTVSCKVTKIDQTAGKLKTADGLEIPFEDLCAIDGPF